MWEAIPLLKSQERDTVEHTPHTHTNRAALLQTLAHPPTPGPLDGVRRTLAIVLQPRVVQIACGSADCMLSNRFPCSTTGQRCNKTRCYSTGSWGNTRQRSRFAPEGNTSRYF